MNKIKIIFNSVFLLIFIFSCSSSVDKPIVERLDQGLIANDQSYNVYDILLSKGTPNLIEIINQPSGGSINLSELIYVPSNNFIGIDTFKIKYIFDNNIYMIDYSIEVRDAIAFISSPQLTNLINPSNNTEVLFAKRIDLQTNIPTKLNIIIKADGVPTKELLFSSFSEFHIYPLYTFSPNSSYELDFVLEDEKGLKKTFKDYLQIETKSLPDNFPSLEIEINTSLPQEPGPILIQASSRGVGAVSYGILIDDAGEIVGAFDDEIFMQTEEKNFIFFQPPLNIVEYNPYTEDINSVEHSSYETQPLHHDAKKISNGNYLTIARELRRLPNYPSDPYDQNTFDADGGVLDELILEIDSQGSVVSSWSLIDLIGYDRITYFSHVTKYGGYDWGHANAVSYEEDTDLILVSVRHQDAIVAFTRSSGELKWILGNHDNWSALMKPYLLNPIIDDDNPFEWQFAQHDIMPLGDGRYSLFDNGNYRSSPFNGVAPIEQDSKDNYSRAVIYEVDQEDMTIKQDWSYTPNPYLFSASVSSVRVLDDTQNILVCFGALGRTFGDPVNAIIHEISPSDNNQVIVSIGVSSNVPGAWGFRSYRSWPIKEDYIILPINN